MVILSTPASRVTSTSSCPPGATIRWALTAIPVGGQLRRDAKPRAPRSGSIPSRPRTSGVTTIASDQTWWCDERPNAALRSPDSNSVTYPSVPDSVSSAFAISAW